MSTHDCASAFSGALTDRAARDDRICAVINDSAETHHLEAFAARHGNRFIDVGIAEQSMVGISSGLANFGLLPFVCSAACFLSARALEQIKIDIAYMGSNVKLCGFVSGLSYGSLGGSHHAIEDIAWMRAIPGMSIVAPASPRDAVSVLDSVLEHDGPVYIRLVSKDIGPEIFGPGEGTKIGESCRIRAGADVTLLGTGLASSGLPKAADDLAALGVDAEVIHVGSIKPLDEVSLLESAAKTGRVVTVEEHLKAGGLGSAVAELLAEHRPTPLKIICVPDEYGPVGPADWLRNRYGLAPGQLAPAIFDWLDRESS